mgnify:CR=1 FL=1
MKLFSAKWRALPVVFVILASSCSHRYFIVRHAEKMTVAPNMNSDVGLSVPGEQRADDLLDRLKKDKIKYAFTTQTVRTISTITPTADYFNIDIQFYGPKPDSVFINKLRALKKNTLIVGHSNTVDDIVNMLCGTIKVPADLKDNEYDHLFIIKKRGNRYLFKSENTNVRRLFPIHSMRT